MIRRPPLETKINHERWLVSYADFITLLFAFFVVMYSVSHVSESKYRILSQTLDTTFSGKVAEFNPAEGESDQSNYTAQLDDIQSELESVLAGILETGDVSLSGNEQWVDIQLNANILFPSGSAEPSDEAKSIFSDIADVLAASDNAIAVGGHTDNVPINTNEFKNNWELSSARAVAIVGFLSYNSVLPERMSAVGYGEYQPIASNETLEGRAKNRRVVLRVSSEAVSLPPQLIEVGLDVVNDGTQESIPSSIAETASEQTDQQDNKERTRSTVQPVKLESGGLLFTSDPDLPRTNPPVSDPDVQEESDR